MPNLRHISLADSPAVSESALTHVRPPEGTDSTPKAGHLRGVGQIDEHFGLAPMRAFANSNRSDCDEQGFNR